jgi:hypothetical protein
MENFNLTAKEIADLTGLTVTQVVANIEGDFFTTKFLRLDNDARTKEIKKIAQRDYMINDIKMNHPSIEGCFLRFTISSINNINGTFMRKVATDKDSVLKIYPASKFTAQFKVLNYENKVALIQMLGRRHAAAYGTRTNEYQQYLTTVYYADNKM